MKFFDWLKNNWVRACEALFVGTLMYGLLNLAVAAIFMVFEKLVKAGEWLGLGIDVVVLCAFIYCAYKRIIEVNIEPRDKN